MMPTGLTPYWITTRNPHGPIGFGVTAHSRDDALAIIRAFDYEDYLPSDSDSLSIAEGVTPRDLPSQFVVDRMGPISVRGIWYPFREVGLPAWVVERLNGMRDSRLP